MVDLVKIVQQTPLLQRLLVSLPQDLTMFVDDKEWYFNAFQEAIIDFQPLKKLNYLSFSMSDENKHARYFHLSLNQIQIFIDRCCPDNKILKKIIMNLYTTKHEDELCSTIHRYKNTIDRFDFYGVFRVNNEYMNRIKKTLSNSTQFIHIIRKDFLEEDDLLHIYSLPFRSNSLYHFTPRLILHDHTSFSSVRHLHISDMDTNYTISFRLIAKTMPNLISIYFNIGTLENRDIFIPEIVLDEDIFHHVRFLHLPIKCHFKKCVCGNLLCHLLDRMPKLKCLDTSYDSFLFEKRQFPSIEKFIYSNVKVISVDMIMTCLPKLTTLSVNYLTIAPNNISTIVTSFFIGFPSFKSISVNYDFLLDCKKHESYEKSLQEAIIFIQNINYSLRHIALNLECRIATFYRRNF